MVKSDPMSDYCLRLPKEYAHRLELLGEALHSIHEVVSTAGLVDASSASGIQKPLSTLGYVGLIPESDVRDAMVQGLGPLVFDQDERRRWASWQLEVLLATGMPTVRARAVAADASAALTLLARGYYRGMQQMLHVRVGVGRHARLVLADHVGRVQEAYRAGRPVSLGHGG